MASLYVAEYPHASVQQGTGVPVAFVPTTGAIAEQKLAIGGISVAGVAFNKNTKLIRLHCDVTCSIAFGPVATVTATANKARMQGGQTEYFAAQPDGSMTVAVITNV